jgi:hypothetical protein
MLKIEIKGVCMKNIRKMKGNAIWEVLGPWSRSTPLSRQKF